MSEAGGRPARARPRPGPLPPFSPNPATHQPLYSHTPAARSFSCTVFTFGQTGSGKTYTLTGPPPQVSGALVEPPGDQWARSLGERRLPDGKELDDAAQLHLFAGKERSGKVKGLGQSRVPGLRCPLYFLALMFFIYRMTEN